MKEKEWITLQGKEYELLEVELIDHFPADETGGDPLFVYRVWVVEPIIQEDTLW